jgi:hypothetical protein
MTVTYIQPAKTPNAKCLAEGSITAARRSLIAFPMRAPNKHTRTTEKSLFQINAKYCHNGKNAIVNDAENIAFK